ncbi:MAG: DUF4433 domain-containing protein [Caldilineaceae bacterium]|nr:DUF4433 domain-containing protein [Caldilineaceae bacterium]
MSVPAQPKIYHIVHVDRLPSIIADGYLWCDAEVVRRKLPGATIGMNSIKQRRLEELTLSNYPDLHVGDCVPFYFCPRSIMLYLLYRGNHSELAYRGGQTPIIHLEADLYQSVAWAKENKMRWAFTLSNAGSNYFEDRNNLAQLYEINWPAVEAIIWTAPSVKEGKQAEFLMEHMFPWHLVEHIGVFTQNIYQRVVSAFAEDGHRPRVEILPGWYY